MKTFASLAATAILSLSVTTTALAVPVIFNVEVTGPFEDAFSPPFPLVEPAGMLTGSFTVDNDLGSDPNLVESNEITAFSFTTSGFTQELVRNFTIADTDPGAFASVNNVGVTNEIAPGLSAGLLEFSNADVFLQLDLQVAGPAFFGAQFFHAADLSFATLRSENLTIDGQSFPTPVPALGVNGPLEFGNVRLGTDAGLDAEAANIGDPGSFLEDVTFGGASGDFTPTTDDNQGDLGVGDPALTRTYTYTPSDIGDDTEVVAISASNADDQSITLEGTGVGPDADIPLVIDFGLVDAGNTDLADLLVSNLFNPVNCNPAFPCGDDLTGLSINGFAFDGGTLFDFNAGSDPTGDVISALDSATYSLLFGGSLVAGVYTDVLRLFTDEGAAFGGNGTAFVIELMATVRDPGPGVPVPAPLALIGLGLFGLGAYRGMRD